MFRRIVKVCCFTDEGQLKLQIFDACEEEAAANETENIGFLSMSPPDKNLSQHFLDSTRLFNLWEKETTKKFLKTENLKFNKSVVSGRDNRIKYRTCNVTIPFPTNVDTFLRIFGSLESVLESILQERRHKKQKLFITFQETPINTQMLTTDFLYELITKSQVAPDATTKFLIDNISAWILTTVDKNPDFAEPYGAVITRLKSLLANTSGSITTTIQRTINPHKEVEDYLKELKKDKELAEIFDPDVSITMRTRGLLGKCIPGTVKRNRLFDRIETKFPITSNTQKRCAQLIWEKLLLKVIGKGPDANGVLYSRKHSEIAVLRNSTLILHNNGLIELGFHKTPAYQKYYANGCDDFLTFIPEMRLICDFLELPLHEKESRVSHQAIFFSEAASLRLINYGLHITRKYVDSILSASHRALLFKRTPERPVYQAENTQKPTMTVLPKDVLIYILRLAVDEPLLNQDFNWAYNRSWTNTPK